MASKTEIKQIRALIPDRKGEIFAFSDEDGCDGVEVFFDIEGNVKKAAAAALETAASDAALRDKVVELLDLKVNGAAASQALLQRADRLRKQADDEAADTDDGGFGVIEYTHRPPVNEW